VRASSDTTTIAAAAGLANTMRRRRRSCWPRWREMSIKSDQRRVGRMSGSEENKADLLGIDTHTATQPCEPRWR